MKEYKKSILDYEDMKKSLAYVDELAYNRGIAEGEERGKAEERSNIAKLLLLRGVDINIITNTTRLSEEELLKLTKAEVNAT